MGYVTRLDRWESLPDIPDLDYGPWSRIRYPRYMLFYLDNLRKGSLWLDYMGFFRSGLFVAKRTICEFFGHGFDYYQPCFYYPHQTGSSWTNTLVFVVTSSRVYILLRVGLTDRIAFLYDGPYRVSAVYPNSFVDYSGNYFYGGSFEMMFKFANEPTWDWF